MEATTTNLVCLPPSSARTRDGPEAENSLSCVGCMRVSIGTSEWVMAACCREGGFSSPFSDKGADREQFKGSFNTKDSWVSLIRTVESRKPTKASRRSTSGYVPQSWVDTCETRVWDHEKGSLGKWRLFYR